MNIRKYISFTVILFLAFITNAHAACTQEEINEFKRIEDEYKVTYEFDKDTIDYTLTIHYANLDKYFIEFTDVETEYTEGEFTENSFEIKGIKPGKYIFSIVGSTKTCNDKLKTITLNLSDYNKYSEDPLCEGIEEFVLCQPTYDKEIDYETFVSRVNTYKNTKVAEEEKQKKEEKPKQDEIINKVIDYIQEYILSIIVIAIFIILLIITIIITAKSIRKSRRLE